MLKERGNASEDVLELAIDLIEGWQLSSLHADLADLVLDPGAPLHPRVSAGYALARSGSRDTRSRLKPLVGGTPEDPDDELKGLALRCCWPEDFSTRELLPLLQPWRDRHLHGAYFGFLLMLDQAGFDASDDRLGGLIWSKSVLQTEPSTDPAVRIGRRIAHGGVTSSTIRQSRSPSPTSSGSQLVSMPNLRLQRSEGTSL